MPSGWGSPGEKAGVLQPQTPRMTASTATLPNASSGLVSAAIPPSTGPKSAPKMAAPTAAPSSSPRRPGGAPAASHEKDAVQENALDSPCRNRATSTSQKASAIPNVSVVMPMPASPARTTGLTPSLAAAIPPGSAPNRAPAAYDEARTPASDLERPSSSL